MRAALLSACLLLGACGDNPAGAGPDAAPEPLPPVDDPLEYVDPFIGSGGFGYALGSAFPGAAAPHGLAKVGPDTRGEFGTVRFLHYSGYWYPDDKIQGFSHLHLHGTGATDYGVLSLMPSDGFDAERTTPRGYESPFRKETESAAPGTYAVTLDRGDIDVEITATSHAAHHRFTWPEDAGRGWVILDLGKHLEGGSVGDAELTLDPDNRRITGRLRSLGEMTEKFGGYDVFFTIESRTAWAASQVWADGAAPADGTAASGLDVGAALEFELTGEPVELRVGISLVDAEGAAENLATELPAWDFEATRSATAAAWDTLLRAVLVEGGTLEERRMFYSALYRGFLMPTETSDADGRYRFGDDTVRTAEGRFLTDMSLWDTYRTLHPLYALIAPESALDSVRSLSTMGQILGFFPKWPLATGESGVMLGSSADIVIADAVLRGIDGFEVEDTYQRLRAIALAETAEPRGGWSAVVDYIVHGYVPASHGRSVSQTTEYAHADFALGQLAGHLGHDGDATMFTERSHGYHALFDPDTGFLRGHYADGTMTYTDDFDPLAITDDYAEANAWHSVWMTGAHDIDGLVGLFGGSGPFIVKLETFFDEAAADLALRPHADMVANYEPRPYYWHGNEPDIHAAYLFAQAGRPDLTARWVRWIMTELYNDQPNGLAGNDDGGTLSAWYAFSALGLYPIPGSDRYILGIPLFTRARIARPGGDFIIETTGEGSYVQAVTLDGAPVATPELHHADLAAGSVLVFELGPEPSTWGQP